MTATPVDQHRAGDDLRDLLAGARGVLDHCECRSDCGGWYCRIPAEWIDALQRCVQHATERPT